jgi:hypothetical protein
MKNIFIIIIFSICLVSCSTALKKSIEVDQNAGKRLDALWKDYFSTGDPSSVLAVMEVIDWPDLMKSQIDKTLQADLQPAEMEKLHSTLSDLAIGLDSTGRQCVSLYDIDIELGILLGGDLNAIVKELFKEIGATNWLILRATIKSAAFWSLIAESRQHPDVLQIVLDNAGRSKPSSRHMLDTFLPKPKGDAISTPPD